VLVEKTQEAMSMVDQMIPGTDPAGRLDAPRASTASRKKKILITLAVLAAVGAVVGIGLLVLAPIPTMIAGGTANNFVRTLLAPAGTVTTELNRSFTGSASNATAFAAAAPSPNAPAEDWPSYNRTLSSDRYSPLSQINTTNVGRLKVLCTYDTGRFTAFETGLIMVNSALIGTTEHDIFSLNPATCAENWRTHGSWGNSMSPANRGAAYMDGRLFRGTTDCRVLAFDFKTGKPLWETTICDTRFGETVPSAPIAWDGLVFVGNAGGDYKGGKGHMFALEAKTGKVVWEFFLAPQQEGDTVRGPLGTTPLDTSSWRNLPGIPVSGGGTWTSYTLDTNTGALYVPGGNPAPDFDAGARVGGNLYTDSVVVLDAKTGAYRYHYKIVPKDWHDWDVSNPPVLVQTRGGKQLLAIAPKNGFLYGFDLANNKLLYRVPITQTENGDTPFSIDKDVHFCPGPVGGEEWNSPSFVPETNLILTAAVDWCATVRLKDNKELREKPLGKPWSGMATINPLWSFGKLSRADGHWSGWVYAVDADTGVWKWRLKSNYPIVGAWTPTAGGVLFFGDVGGNFYAIDSATGQKLWGQALDGAVAGGVVTYVANGEQKVAVAAGFTHIVWPTITRTAKVVVLGLAAEKSGQ
jgi:alcohol dehydrogenase (cytochrome c)